MKDIGRMLEKRHFEGASWDGWAAAHSVLIRQCAEGLVLAETEQLDWHLMRLTDEAFQYRRVRLRGVFERTGDMAPWLYVHHFGSLDVAEIDFHGCVRSKMDNALVDVRPVVPGQSIEVAIEYLNCHSTISLGFSNEGSKIYVGRTESAFLIRWLAIEVHDGTADLSTLPDEERVVLVDVGGQEGLQLKWMLRAPDILPVVFEPIHSEAAKLRAVTGRIPGAQIIEYGLSNRSGPETLNMTRASGCSSVLMPNGEFLSQYDIGWIFDVVGRQAISCERYDSLFARGVTPAPDVIKIDVQGFEYQVLLGFGDLLNRCLAIEVESHLYQIYREQRLLGDLVSFLADFGFALRSISPVPNFDGDIVEADVQFTKRRAEVATYDVIQRKKFDLICRTWNIWDYS